MKSGKQRREEIKAKRLGRLRATQAPNPYMPIKAVPLGAVAADPAQLAHNNTYGLLPSFYIDTPFVCRDCGAHEIWTAKQQKWWYEIAKGHIDTCAVRCRPCRLLERARVDEARRVSQAGMALKMDKKKSDENRNKNNN
jgi:hypothetical protein